MQSVPRPLASVSLGGSLRASRAALLARPRGPLAAVDLADGRSLTVEDRGAGWVACVGVDQPAALPLPVVAEQPADVAPAPVRRRRLGTALVLAGALGAAIVALATGFSGAPAPAVAGPLVRAGPPVPVAGPHPRAAHPLRPAARGGRASALPGDRPPAAPAPPTAALAVAPPPPPPPPQPAALPALPSVPALGGLPGFRP